MLRKKYLGKFGNRQLSFHYAYLFFKYLCCRYYLTQKSGKLLFSSDSVRYFPFNSSHTL